MTIISTLPDSLTNGTTADATQVMADLNQIVNNVNANAAANGANSDITSLSGLTSPITVAQGGTSMINGVALAISLTGVSGTNTITATASPPIGAYATGQLFILDPAATNTGATTLNVSSLGAKQIVDIGGTALSGGELLLNDAVLIVYDGTAFRIAGTGAAVPFGKTSTEGDMIVRSSAGIPVRIAGPQNWQIPIGLLQGSGGPAGAIEWGHINTFTSVTNVDPVNDRILKYDSATAQNKVISPNNLLGGVRPAFSAYASGGQAVASGARDKIQFNNIAFDTNSNFDAVTNYRFTPTVAGYYWVHVRCGMAISTGHQFDVNIYKSGGPQAQSIYDSSLAANTVGEVSTLVHMNGSTDYLEAYIGNGDTVSQNVVTGAISTEFSGFRIV